MVDLARIVGSAHVSNRDADRLAYGRDAWARDVMRMRSGEVPSAPQCVVWPGTAAEVADVLALAEKQGLAVVPYGAGASSVGSARPAEGGIVLDLKRMRAIRSFNETNLIAEVEAGVIGKRLEMQLNARGYTLGHFPPSLGNSTLGGWLATRSAGQMSTRYGKIEDMTLGLEVATAGRVRRAIMRPRPAKGVDFNSLFLGAEGTFGAITAARLRVRPLVAAPTFTGFRFASLSAGIETLRRIMQAQLRPAVLRLYDGVDTLVGLVPGTADRRDEVRALDPLTDRAQSVLDEVTKRLPGWAASGRIAQRLRTSFMQGTVRAVIGSPMMLNRALKALPEDCLLVMGFEGQPALVSAELAEAKAIALSVGGVDLGPEPGEQWYQNRFKAPFRQPKVYAAGLFMDTFEATATWDRLIPMYRAVKRAMTTDAVVMAHFAHAYPTGCAVSFTFAATGPDPRDATAGLARYDRIVDQAIQAVHETGGSVGHHHGIGTARASAMAREHGPGGLRILGAIKHGLDPSGIMNPGKLGLPVVPLPRPRTASAEEKGFAAAVTAAVGESNVVSSGTRTTVRPPDENALAAVLRVAHSRGLAVFCDQTGFRPAAKAVQLDLRRLEGVPRMSTHAQFVEAEGGVVVHRLEALLHQHGLTMGPLHPRSLLRTVGAALSRNLLLRRSTADGDLAGLCMRVRALVANGTVVETRLAPRPSAGPDIGRTFIGGQGRLGIITKAVLRVRSIPRFSDDVCYDLDGLEAALATARRVLQRDIRPAAARLVPLDDGAVRFALRLVAPSEAHLRAQRTILSTAAREAGATDIGAVVGLAEGGVFDTVVEAPLSWGQSPAAMRAVTEVGCDDVWLDFLTAEGVTIVCRVPDADTRRAAVAALTALGAPIVAGDPGEARSPFDDALEATARLLDPSGVFRARSPA